MIRVIFAALLLLPAMAGAQTPPPVLITPAPEPAVRAAPAPVVLELFTSQGCAYCPPADELLGKLAQQQNIIALSCHVDYFPVRKNNLGKGLCSRRQMDYNRLMGNGPRYTPQLVVNGLSHLIGYEANKVSAAIMKARAQKMTPLALNRAPQQGYYYFNLPAMDYTGGNLRLGMFIFAAPKRLVMTEGNNFGKTITYTNVVERFEDLGLWDGLPATRTINANYGPADAGIAVIVQNISTGQIIAAGQALR